MADEAFDYSNTVNLPKTAFPQKAGLAQQEPLRIEKWRRQAINDQLSARKDRPDFIFHDGPPYANGDIHIGHTLNKVLKDIIIRYKTLTGYRVHYIHGNDCHGLPIEQKVVDKLREEKTYDEKSPLEIRKLCAEYALGWVMKQREQFERLGVSGDFEKSYNTMAPSYEVAELRALQEMVRRGLVYKGLKVVFWDPVFETALAEAEIEYNENHVSPSVYVRFPLKGTHPKIPAGKTSIVIWTTTPWTLPANLGVSLHPEYVYVVYRVGEEQLIVAKGLLETFVAETGLSGGEVVAEFLGSELDRAACEHPIHAGKESLVMVGDHVTLEQGTGCVHTAPGHGVDDFNMGKRYGLPIFCPVDERGCYTHEYAEMERMSVFKANPVIVERLQASGHLLQLKNYTHSYPYSWRSRKPVIMRATEQWFLSIDAQGLRQKALAECEKVRWIPSWGRDRIVNMLATRPDWCLSRQRSWGVPIPSVIDKRTKQGVLTVELIERFISFVEKEGSDCWYERSIEDFLPESMKADAEHYEKEFNTCDVWFDSGSSHLAVLNGEFDLTWPADLYLEGADQHRGWFQHSLWVGVATRDAAPFRAVLTHGFVLDEHKRPMSKSLGNVINPLDVIKEYGADVLRMWVSSEDYRGDVSISKNALGQISNAYRRIRNSIRFVLGNLSDFDPAKNTVPYAELGDDDKYTLHELKDLVGKVREAYDKFEFHRVYQLVNGFCVKELGALYLDITKDRLYCSAPDDLVRRASQTVLYQIGSILPRLLAPILPFTADEAWEHLHGNPERCIHLEDFPVCPPEWKNEEIHTRFQRLLALREQVTAAIEPLRAKDKKIIGNSLDAKVILRSDDPETIHFLEAHHRFLERFLIVSQVYLYEAPAGQVSDRLAEVGLHLSLEVGKAEGQRCPRCWRWTDDHGSNPDHPELCARCADVLRRQSG